MNHDRATALTLGLGAVGVVVTMALHPTHGLYGLEGDRLIRAARFTAWVHGLGVASLALLLLGAWGVVDRLGPRSWSARAGLVAFAVAAIAGSCAATISGITAPHVAHELLEASSDAPEARRMGLIVLHPIVLGFNDVMIVAMALAPLLWARVLLVHARTPGILGAALGAVGLTAFLGDVLVGEVHSLGIFLTGFAAWLVVLASWMWRTAGTTVPPATRLLSSK